MSSSLSGKHYFSICFGTKGGWGHSRPELIFSFRLLRLHKHIVLTLLLPANFRDRIQKEIVTFKLNPEEQARARIAWFDVPSAPPFDINGGEEDDGRWALAADWQAAFALVPYGRLLRGDEICDAPHPKPHSRPPDVIFVDVILLLGFRPYLAALSRDAGVKIPLTYRLMPTSLSFSAMWFAGEATAFVAAARAYIEEIQNGTEKSKAYDKHIGSNDTLLDARVGLGKTYRLNFHMSSIYRIILDAEFSPTVMTFPACLGSISHFDPKHKFYQAGAQMILDDEEDDSLDAENDKKQTSKNDGGDETISFLDKAKEDEGDRSVIFVCFGTSFWPPTNQQTKVFLSALEESGLRVLLVPCQVDEEVKEVSAEWAEKMGEKAMMSDWAPQWEILAHPATAVFVTHGGSNSAQEAMLNGMPTIIWPGAWDQPLLASQLDSLGIGIELVQIRTGSNIGRVTAKGVKIEGTDEALKVDLSRAFERVQGEAGDRMKERAMEVRRMVRSDMQAGGEGWRAMMELGHLAD